MNKALKLHLILRRVLLARSNSTSPSSGAAGIRTVSEANSVSRGEELGLHICKSLTCILKSLKEKPKQCFELSSVILKLMRRITRKGEGTKQIKKADGFTAIHFKVINICCDTVFSCKIKGIGGERVSKQRRWGWKFLVHAHILCTGKAANEKECITFTQSLLGTLGNNIRLY